MISGSGSGDQPLKTPLDSAWASLAVKSDECFGRVDAAASA
jgi:hypothetical protein